MLFRVMKVYPDGGVAMVGRSVKTLATAKKRLNRINKGWVETSTHRVVEVRGFTPDIRRLL